MTDYGYNFGLRRSAEQYRKDESRFRTPAGSSWLIGSAVEIDFANPGFLKQSAANAKLTPGVSGLLIQELEWLRSIYQSPADLVDTFMKGIAKPAMLASITSGEGLKFWVKNTPAVTRADGRVISARTVVSNSVIAGDQVGWDGAMWVPANAQDVIATLSAGISTAGAITSLPVTALAEPVASGQVVTVVSGSNTQNFTASGAAAAGATAIAVTSATPNFNYPTGSTVGEVAVTNAYGTCTNVTSTGVVEIVLAA